MTRRARCLAALLVAASATGCGGPEARSTIGWLHTLTVRLAEDWPPGEDRGVAVRCSDPGGCSDVPGGAAALEQPLTGGTARITFGVNSPGALVLRISDAGGVLTEHEAAPEWVRVGGTERCGGPREAEVVVPAP